MNLNLVNASNNKTIEDFISTVISTTRATRRVTVSLKDRPQIKFHGLASGGNVLPQDSLIHTLAVLRGRINAKNFPLLKDDRPIYFLINDREDVITMGPVDGNLVICTDEEGRNVDPNYCFLIQSQPMWLFRDSLFNSLVETELKEANITEQWKDYNKIVKKTKAQVIKQFGSRIDDAINDPYLVHCYNLGHPPMDVSVPILPMDPPLL